MRFILTPATCSAIACCLLPLVAAACGGEDRTPRRPPAETPTPAPMIPTGSWAPALQEHPRLLGPREFLTRQAREKPELYGEIQQGSSLLAAGIVHAVEGLPPDKIEPFRSRAMDNVARGITNLHQDTWVWLNEVALVFDLFHDVVPPADRQKMIEWMNAHLGQYTTDENAFHNSTLSKILCYLRIAYGTWGENPRAKEFRDYALVKLYEGKVVPVLNEFGAGGGFTECGWYTRGSLWNLVQALEMARRFDDYDGFQKAPKFFYQRLAYEMLQPYPGRWLYGSERYAVEGDGSWVYGGHNEYPRHTRTVLAQYFRGSELSRYVASKRRPGSNSAARLADFLYEEEPDDPLPLAGLPPAHLASGIGRVYARSDWTDEATWLRFECGDYWAGHQHFEVGNLEVFRREPLATESGEYVDYLSNHDVNWLARTIAHNCILVYQPGEQWPMMRDGGRNPYANDGGQAKKWEWTVDNLDIWKARRDQFERGDIVAYENRPEYLYVAGDCTAAYSPSKLAKWVRQVVFVRPHTIIVFDRVVSTRPEYEKTWLLHCRNEPDIAGRRMTITNGAGKLAVERLLPARATVRKVEGYTYRGQTFDPTPSVQSEVAPRWRVEVSPSDRRTDDVFLHVLTTGEPRRSQLIEDASDPDLIGVRCGDMEVLFKGELGGVLRLAGKESRLTTEVSKGPYE
jgi:hypothetical protein